MTSQNQILVLIIGGGVVGLAASLFLSYHGIQSVVIERCPGTSVHPRARSVNARTMELFRHLGIDQLVVEAGASISRSKGIYSGPSLKEVIESRPQTQDGGTSSIEWPTGTFVTQDILEPLLVDAVRERGGEDAVRFNTECVRVDQDSDGVTATLKDRANSTTSTLCADYLIAADGAKSPIRTQLGVPTIGQGTMGHLLNILFNANLKDLVYQREFSLCIIDRPEIHGLFTSINNSDRWVFHLSYDPSKGEQASDFTPERCSEILHMAIGIPNIEINIQSIIPWEPSVRVAKQLQHGRVFLAGDSAHQMPPYRRQGANSGIADAHNLAWKLAAVLNGHAGKALLETYHAERFPVGLEAAEASATGADDRGLISVKWELAVARGFLRKIPLSSGHGYGYASAAVCVENTFPLGGLSWKPWNLPSLLLAIDGRPGRRAPHMWVERQGKRVSTLDLFGKGFVLLAGADGASWLGAAKEVSAALGVDVVAYCVGPEGDLFAPAGTFESAAGISSRGAVLVRPDDFVAWRERRLPSDSQTKLEAAAKQVLCLAS